MEEKRQKMSVEEEETAKPILLGTHGGKFHLDDALSAYMLRCLPEYKSAKIVRDTDPVALERQGCEVIFDIGGIYDHDKKRYDHHQRGFSEVFTYDDDDNGGDNEGSSKAEEPGNGDSVPIKMAASGLIWRHYGKRIIAELWPKDYPSVPLTDANVERVYIRVYKTFIRVVDAGDNGISPYPADAFESPEKAKPLYYDGTTLASRVSNLNPSWIEKGATKQLADERFEQASQLAGTEFVEAVMFSIKSYLLACTIVDDVFRRRYDVHQSGHVLVFEKEENCPYKNILEGVEERERQKAHSEGKMYYPVLYCVSFDGAREQWTATALNVRPGSFECRVPFPEAWRGLRDDELSRVAEIENCKFCHLSGFLSCNTSREGILKMIEFSMESQAEAVKKYVESVNKKLLK